MWRRYISAEGLPERNACATTDRRWLSGVDWRAWLPDNDGPGGPSRSVAMSESRSWRDLAPRAQSVASQGDWSAPPTGQECEVQVCERPAVVVYRTVAACAEHYFVLRDRIAEVERGSALVVDAHYLLEGGAS